jgi:Oxidoreductase molybdopterin binding domain
MEQRSRGLPLTVAMVVGVLGAGAALAAGDLVAAFIDPDSSPFLAVGNSAIDLTPLPLKDFAVRTFGTNDKLVLLSGMGAFLLAVAAIAGALSRRRPLPGVMIFLLPHRLAHREVEGQVPGRRAFLLGSPATVVGIGVAGAGGRLFIGKVDVAGSRAKVTRMLAKRTQPKVPAGTDFAGDGTPTFLTPNARFYRVDTALSVPRLRAEDWTFRVHGMVDHELNLAFSDIMAMDLVTRTITMTCVSNEVGGPYFATANFTGVLLRDLLAKAGVRTEADQVLSSSVDGYSAGSPVSAVLDPNRAVLGPARLQRAGVDQDGVAHRRSPGVAGGVGRTGRGRGHRVGADQGDHQGRGADGRRPVAAGRPRGQRQRPDVADVADVAQGLRPQTRYAHGDLPRHRRHRLPPDRAADQPYPGRGYRPAHHRLHHVVTSDAGAVRRDQVRELV